MRVFVGYNIIRIVMIKDLVKMEVSEVDSLLLQATHFNLSFNRSTKYKPVFEVLRPLAKDSVKELWTFITNTARALKCRATALSIPKQFAPYKDNKQGISHSRIAMAPTSLYCLHSHTKC